MPIYEYECTNCGKVTEVMQKFSDEPLTQCPSCAGSLRKLISMSTFHLKGSGWYVTDYASKSSSGTSAKKSTSSTTSCSDSSTSKENNIKPSSAE